MNVLLLILFTLFSPLIFSYDEVCSSVRIKKVKKLDLTANEKLLLCGDKKVKEYQSIPPYQAKFFLEGFLQSRGYLRPRMKIKNGVLKCDPGKISKVKKIRLEAEDEKVKNKVQTELRQLYNKRVLSTDMLNSIEGETLSLVRTMGYPCAKISSVADIDESLVRVKASDMKFFEFGPVDREEIPGLHERALNRFYPFIENEPFNADLLRLTEKRMTRSEVVQGTYFLDRCEGDEFDLKQQFIVGPPRTLRMGVGASTEVGPKASFKWSHNRYKSMASQLALIGNASFRVQTLKGTADLFFWKNEPRRSLYTEAEIKHETQVDFEQTVYGLRPSMKWTRDSEGFSKLYIFGPSYEGGTFYSENNSSTRSFSTGVLEGFIQWMSHDYELFDILPQKGKLFTLNMDYRHPMMGFAASDLLLDFNTVIADRLSTWGRGNLIGAAHLQGATSWIDTSKASIGSLPPTVKFYGGGSHDIRGFYLNTLPDNGGLGALTKVMGKFELRKTYFFHQSLEAFSFVDAGYFNEEPWTVDQLLYYSPGGGLRWLSPIGLVQGYVARGFQSNPYRDSGNLYFAGIGGTF